jgi:hypothetical protein
MQEIFGSGGDRGGTPAGGPVVESEAQTEPATAAGRGLRGRRRLTVAVVIGAAGVLLVVAAVVALSTGEGTITTAATNPSMAPATTTTNATTTEAPTTTAAEPGAADVLEPFFAAATTLDGQLHEAAAAINGAGPPWTSISQQVADSVQAAALEPVARTIPAGLPPDLLQSVILVYSDLASRRYAMQGFGRAHDAYPEDLLAEIRNGHPAAERFDDDLAALRSQAASTPPVTVQPADSRQAAEVLLLAQYVDGLNTGCGSRGGAIVTDLPTVEWVPTVGPDGTPTGSQTDGNINGVEFAADLDADSTWAIELIAC